MAKNVDVPKKQIKHVLDGLTDLDSVGLPTAAGPATSEAATAKSATASSTKTASTGAAAKAAAHGEKERSTAGAAAGTVGGSLVVAVAVGHQHQDGHHQKRRKNREVLFSSAFLRPVLTLGGCKNGFSTGAQAFGYVACFEGRHNFVLNDVRAGDVREFILQTVAHLQRHLPVF